MYYKELIKINMTNINNSNNQKQYKNNQYNKKMKNLIYIKNMLILFLLIINKQLIKIMK